MRPPCRISKIARWVQTPLATLVCFGLLAGCVWLTFTEARQWRGYRYWSRLVSPWRSFVRILPPTTPPPPFTAWVGRGADGWTLIGTTEDSADGVSKATAADPSKVFEVSSDWDDAAIGFFDPAVRRTELALEFSRADGATVTEAEARAILAFLEAHPAARGSSEWTTGSSGSWTGTAKGLTRIEHEVRWASVANNSVAALAVGGFVVSLPWIPRMLRNRRRARRIARGWCGACGYDRAGTPADAACPECGKAPEGRP